MSGQGPPGAGVPNNDWRRLEVPSLGAWSPESFVSVILPYYQAPRALENTIAGLAAQTYPKNKFEVIVADDGSDPPAAVPSGYEPLAVRVVRQEDRGFGLARARNTGAEAATGDILVFLDSDMIPDPQWLEAHARWHHLVANALTLGFRRHVDVTGLTPDDVSSASAGGGLAGLFADRPQEVPDWIEFHMTRTNELTSAHDDLFRVVTGGNLGVRRDTFEAAGRFDESFTQWGAEDTEFGYRAFTNGSILIPERAAAAWHQGLGTLPDSSEQHSQEEQRARIAHLIAEPSFRRGLPGRSYEVPTAVVRIAAGSHAPVDVRDAVEGSLASSFHDHVVFLDIPDEHPERAWLDRQFGPDPRVVVGADLDDHLAYPFAAVRVTLPVEAELTEYALESVIRVLEGVGAVEVPLADAPPVRAVKTRAWRRSTALSAADPWHKVDELYGVRVMNPREAGIRRRHRMGRAPLVRSDSRAGKVLARAGRIRSASDLALFVRWLFEAVRWRLEARVARRMGLQRPGAIRDVGSLSDRPVDRGPPRSPIRVGVVGGGGIAVIRDAARAISIEPHWSGSLESHVGPVLDLILVDDRPPGFTQSDIEQLRKESEQLGAAWLELDGADAPLPAVDVGAFSPVGFRPLTDARFAVLVSAQPRSLADAAKHVGREPVDAFVRGRVALPETWRRYDLPEDPAELVRSLRRYDGVLAHPGFHETDAAYFESLLQLGAAGVPVVCELADDDVEVAGEGVVEALRGISRQVVADPHQRELASIRLRRQVLVSHSPEARLRQVERRLGLPVDEMPTVSAVMATNRPEFLPHAVEQLARQVDSAELVVVLHGFGERDGPSRRLIESRIPHVAVVSVDANQPFGDALNAATKATTGEVIAKFDDDDWYSADHVLDLVLALQYSGADLVGKGAEFVYLASDDSIIRRFVGGAETFSTTIGGGALAVRRAALNRAGGWRRARRYVDRGLIEDVQEVGGVVYRTHGFGYVLHRHGRGHTWETDDRYFLAQADAQRPGLDLEFAGVD